MRDYRPSSSTNLITVISIDIISNEKVGRCTWRQTLSLSHRQSVTETESVTDTVTHSQCVTHMTQLTLIHWHWQSCVVTLSLTQTVSLSDYQCDSDTAIHTHWLGHTYRLVSVSRSLWQVSITHNVQWLRQCRWEWARMEFIFFKRCAPVWLASKTQTLT